jgi:hypothetical protein
MLIPECLGLLGQGVDMWALRSRGIDECTDRSLEQMELGAQFTLAPRSECYLTVPQLRPAFAQGIQRGPLPCYFPSRRRSLSGNRSNGQTDKGRALVAC